MEPMEDYGLQNCYLQPGGVVDITYGEHRALAPREHIIKHIIDLRAMLERKRRFLMQATLKEIAKNLRRLEKAEADGRSNDYCTDIAIEIAQDIGIWYANEIVTGRVSDLGLIGNTIRDSEEDSDNLGEIDNV